MRAEPDTRLITDIYACCDTPERWQMVLDEICERTGSRNAAVQLFRRRGSQLQQQWCARDSRSMAHAAQHDGWVNNDENPRLRLESTPPVLSRAMTDRDRFPRGSPALAALRKRLAHIGLSGGTGILVDIAPSHFFSLILHRGLDDAEKCEAIDTRFLDTLAPHLRQAGGLAMKFREMKSAHAVIASVVDQIRIGVVICKPSGELLWCNRRAEEMIVRSSAVNCTHGVLRCSRSKDQTAFSRLLADAGTAPTSKVASIGSDHDDLTQIIVLPAGAASHVTSAWPGNDESVSIILVDKHCQPAFSIEATAALYGLAPAEARLAIALCHGSSVSEYAHAKGISVGTARIQLKQALAKTNSRRQGELVGKLYSSVLAQMS